MQLHNFETFERASLALIRTRDVDPVYPLLRRVIEAERTEPEVAAFMYVYYYSLESMVRWVREHDRGRSPAEAFAGVRHFGMERSRSPQVRQPSNFQAALERWQRILPIIRRRSLGFDSGRELIKTVPFFGDWASYKMCEVLDQALGYSNLRIKGLGIEGQDPNKPTGPIFGLRYLYGIDKKFSRAIIPEWERFGAELSRRWGAPIGEVESCLCKVPKILHKGSYLVGHDINEFLGLRRSGVFTDEQFWGLMDGCGFDRRFLEYHFTAKHKAAYVSTGRLLFVDGE